nr:hypothetical protein [Ardenticatena sp.]
MNYLHPPRPGEALVERGTATVEDASGAYHETWERYRAADGSTLLRIEQAGAHTRLVHAIISPEGAIDRVQVRVMLADGRHEQTFTFFDDSILIADNRIAGRQAAPLAQLVLMPFAALPVWTTPPTGESTALVLAATPSGRLHWEERSLEVAPPEADTQTLDGHTLATRRYILTGDDFTATLWLDETGALVQARTPTHTAMLTKRGH